MVNVICLTYKKWKTKKCNCCLSILRTAGYSIYKLQGNSNNRQRVQETYRGKLSGTMFI